MFAAEEDSGPIVEALVKEPTAGKKVIGERDSITLAEFLTLFTQTTGIKAEHVAPLADAAQLPVPPFLQGPIWEMTRFWDEFGYAGGDASVISPKDVSVIKFLLRKLWLISFYS